MLPVLMQGLDLVNPGMFIWSCITWLFYDFGWHNCLLPFLISRCPSAAGIIEAVAKDFFDIDVTMDILSMNKEEERTGKKEHVVFLVVQKSHSQMGRAKPNRLKGNQDIQRDQEVLGLLCLQKAQILLVDLLVLEQSVQRTEPNGPSHSGFKADILNLHYWHLGPDRSLLWRPVLCVFSSIASLPTRCK